MNNNRQKIAKRLGPTLIISVGFFATFFATGCVNNDDSSQTAPDATAQQSFFDINSADRVIKTIYENYVFENKPITTDDTILSFFCPALAERIKNDASALTRLMGNIGLKRNDESRVINVTFFNDSVCLVALIHNGYPTVRKLYFSIPDGRFTINAIK